MFYLVGILRQQAWETASQVTLRELLLIKGGGGRGGVKLYRSLQQGASSLNIKRLLLIMKK